MPSLYFFNPTNLKSLSNYTLTDSIVSINYFKNTRKDLECHLVISHSKAKNELNGATGVGSLITPYRYFVAVEHDGRWMPGIVISSSANSRDETIAIKVGGLLDYFERLHIPPGQYATNLKERFYGGERQPGEHTIITWAKSPYAILYKILDTFFYRTMFHGRSEFKLPYNKAFLRYENLKVDAGEDVFFSYSYRSAQQLSVLFEQLAFSPVVNFGDFRVIYGGNDNEFAFAFKIDSFVTRKVGIGSIITTRQEGDSRANAYAYRVNSTNSTLFQSKHNEGLIYSINDDSLTSSAPGYASDNITRVTTQDFLGDICDWVIIGDSKPKRIVAYTFDSDTMTYTYDITPISKPRYFKHSIDKRAEGARRAIDATASTSGYIL